jgi:hypothetical protein
VPQHPVADFEARDALAHLHDFAGKIAAHDERVLDPPGEDVAIIALEPIESVDRDGVIFYDNLVLARPRVFRGFDDQGRLFGGKPGSEV